jgi:hypothetical protein
LRNLVDALLLLHLAAPTMRSLGVTEGRAS